MFRSGVFWMGLVFIPVTSLVFDVAYKVWVSRALFGTTKGKSTGHLVSPEDVPEFTCRTLKMFSFPFCEHANRNIHNIAALSEVDTCMSGTIWKSSVLFPGLCERRVYPRMKHLKCQTLDMPPCWRHLSLGRVKRVCFKTLVDEVQELEALSKDPGAVVHGKRYCQGPLLFRFIFFPLQWDRMDERYVNRYGEVFFSIQLQHIWETVKQHIIHIRAAWDRKKLEPSVIKIPESLLCLFWQQWWAFNVLWPPQWANHLKSSQILQIFRDAASSVPAWTQKIFKLPLNVLKYDRNVSNHAVRPQVHLLFFPPS